MLSKLILKKNEDYKLMVKISHILSGDQESFKGLPEILFNFKAYNL